MARLVRPRNAPNSTLERLILETYGGVSTASGISITPDKALRIGAVYACVLVLSQSVAQLPLHLYRRIEKERNRLFDHPLALLIETQPNEWMTAYEFKQLAMTHLLLRGNSFWLKTRGTNGQVRELIPIHPDRVQGVQQDEQYRLSYKVRRPNQDVDTIPAEAILHLRGLSLDGVRGLSPIEYAREMLGLAVAAEKHGAKMFAQGARLGGILSHPGTLSDEASKRLRESFNESYAGVEQAHKTAVLEEGMKWEKVTMTAEDAQFLESRQFQRSEIAGFFRVPAHFINDLEHATFCLPADELVFTQKGPKPIQDISRDEKIWSRDKNGALILSRVLTSGFTGIDEILTIRTENRELRCNTRHPILIRRKHKEKGIRAVWWESEYVSAGQLKIGDVLITLDHLPSQYGTNACPTREASIEFMEFCGLLLGDGNVIRTRRNNCYISIARAQDAPYMNHYREVIIFHFVSLKNGNGKIRNLSSTRPVHLQEGERQTRFSSVLAVEELEILGFKGTARTKSVPGWVFEMPEDYRLALIRGFLDADGSVDKKGRASFASVNKKMLQQIRYLCISCKIPVTNLREQTGITRLPNGRMQYFTAFYFTASDPSSNLRIGSHTPIYQERMKKGKPFGKKERRYPQYGGRGFEEVGFSLSKIVKITTGSAEPVYDLTIEDNHSFIAEGIVVHNSNVEHLDLAFVKHSLMPWLVNTEQCLQRDLLTVAEKSDHYFKFVVDGILRGDSISRSQSYQRAIMGGWMNPNEVRELEDRNPYYPEGDTFQIPSNMEFVTERDRSNQNE